MLEKGSLIAFIFIFTACAGTIRIAEEDKKGSTIPSKHIMVKPNK